MVEADVILGIKLVRDDDDICLSKSHYIEKALGRFKYQDCPLVVTHFDPIDELTQNNRRPIAQLEYTKVIGYLMYALTSTRPDNAFIIRGGLSRYTRILVSFIGMQYIEFQNTQRQFKPMACFIQVIL